MCPKIKRIWRPESFHEYRKLEWLVGPRGPFRGKICTGYDVHAQWRRRGRFWLYFRLENSVAKKPWHCSFSEGGYMEYNDSAVKLNSILTTRRRRFIPPFQPLGIPPWLRIFSSVQKSYDDLTGRPGYIASGLGPRPARHRCAVHQKTTI